MGSRFRNYGLWAAIFAAIPMIAQAFGFIHIPENYNTLVNLILSIAVGAGILNNPSLGSGYKDIVDIIQNKKE